jgi:hypothetical protein
LTSISALYIFHQMHFYSLHRSDCRCDLRVGETKINDFTYHIVHGSVLTNVELTQHKSGFGSEGSASDCHASRFIDGIGKILASRVYETFTYIQIP